MLGKILLGILIAIIAIILIIVVFVALMSSKNMKKVETIKKESIGALGANNSMVEVECREYEEMKAFGIVKFVVKQYEIKDLGNVSIMTADAKAMQMLTVVITPKEKDLPLLSCDYMYIFGNRKAYVELYDLYLEKSGKTTSWLDEYKKVFGKYSSLEDTQASAAWYDHLLTATCYKMGKDKDDEELNALLLDVIATYSSQTKDYEKLSDTQSAEKAKVCKEYSDGLIANGGISTDFFKKAFGEEVTRKFFDTTFFGTQR